MQGNTATLSITRINLIVFFVYLVYPMVGMGIDLIVPSLPAISYSFHRSATLTKNLVSIYLLGAALGYFLLGFVADFLGRRKLMLGALFIFCFASLLPVLFLNFSILLGVRFLQGITLAAVMLMARAILTDILVDKKLMHAIVVAAMLWGTGPVIGPVIGGYLQFYFGWHACFYFFALSAFICLMGLIFVLPETHYHFAPFNITLLKNNFKTILSHKLFIGLSCLMGMTYSTLFTLGVLGPFLIQNAWGYSAIYFGHLALLVGAAYLSGTIICRQLIKRFNAQRIITASTVICFVIAFMATIAAFTLTGRLMGLLIGSSFLICLTSGLVYPAAMGTGVVLFRHIIGSASSIMLLITLVLSSAIAGAMSLIDVKTTGTVMLVYLAIASACLLLGWFVKRQ